jgi:hypothetical protein
MVNDKRWSMSASGGTLPSLCKGGGDLAPAKVLKFPAAVRRPGRRRIKKPGETLPAKQSYPGLLT